MDIKEPIQLLGGLSPDKFMRLYWQKKPLLIRRALPDFKPLLSRAELFELSSRPDVESRLLEYRDSGEGASWRLKSGPFSRRALPPLSLPNWTLLVQGVDLHHNNAHALLKRFRFLPDARLDDLMISYASMGGGVGPHFDSYDVFLLQASGRRRWQIGRQKDLSIRADSPIKILENFYPEHTYELNPGDMLYLPPRYAHNGVAMDSDCMTYSVGFRAPGAQEVAREILQRIAEDSIDALKPSIYSDSGQLAVGSPGAIPSCMEVFAKKAIEKLIQTPGLLGQILGEYLTEPKTDVWFEAGETPKDSTEIILDRKTKMMHDKSHVFINGESFLATGLEGRLMRKLSDDKKLQVSELKRMSESAQELVQSWCIAGWVHGK
jgi:50S ribosomal protein L16 3-hydroxylase